MLNIVLDVHALGYTRDASIYKIEYVVHDGRISSYGYFKVDLDDCAKHNLKIAQRDVLFAMDNAEYRESVQDSQIHAMRLSAVLDSIEHLVRDNIVWCSFDGFEQLQHCYGLFGQPAPWKPWHRRELGTALADSDIVFRDRVGEAGLQSIARFLFERQGLTKVA